MFEGTSSIFSISLTKMANMGIFCLCFKFVFIICIIRPVSPQIMYENIKEFHGTFTENMKRTACSDSVEACGNRLYKCGIQNQLLVETLRGVQKVQVLQSKCGIRIQKLEMNVSESFSTISSLNRSLLQVNLKLQDCENKLNTENKDMAALSKSIYICNRSLEGSTTNITNIMSTLNTTKQTLYRTMEDLGRKSRDLDQERAKVRAINGSLGRCDKVLVETKAMQAATLSTLKEKERKIVILEMESFQCNSTLSEALSNLTSTLLTLQSVKADHQDCLGHLQVKNVTSVECAQQSSLLNDSLINCENRLGNFRNNFSDCVVRMSGIENELLEIKNIQERQRMDLTSTTLQLMELNNTLQKCEANLSDSKQNISEYALAVILMKTNFSTAISECVNETKRLEERIQTCETSLKINSKNFSEFVNHVSRANLSFLQTLSDFQNKTNELEKELLEYKSKFETIKFLPKRMLKWTVNDLCTNMPNLRVENPELCPFFYDCSQSDSILQQCSYPRLYSDINSRCEDPTSVDCGTRNISYGYTCDFETTSDAGCFLTDSSAGDFTWSRHKGSTSSSDTGPSSAYSGSYYKYIEASRPRVNGDTAILESNKRFQEKTYCLRLRYHMRGSDIGSLKIKTANGTNSPALLRELSRHQGISWHKLTDLNMHLNKDTKILIEATRGKGFKGDIAIDHVTLWPTKCP
ncbi:uncharacterized protein LOC125657221 [Ostrea edulis]|uniref:uncharacterized protein LOC125657221 n=1 Tax=Ostrea edulis TaxID=37623 RepID=UPI0024AF6455|nr:uncharacterized protein LOC125657221 [Ostrea edulis]